MKQVPVKLGPLALLLAVISICLTTLAILSLTTARADRSLAERFANTVTERYALEIRGQEFRRDIAAGGTPAAESDEEGVSWRVFEKDGTSLTVGVGADGEIVSWRQEKEWSPEAEIGNLWMGFQQPGEIQG